MQKPATVLIHYNLLKNIQPQSFLHGKSTKQYPGNISHKKRHPWVPVVQLFILTQINHDHVCLGHHGHPNHGGRCDPCYRIDKILFLFLGHAVLLNYAADVFFQNGS